MRQVDPSTVTITNDGGTGTSGPNLIINGTIQNPIGETDITSVHGPISATTIRGGSISTYSGPHSSLVQSNSLTLTSGTSIGAANACVIGETACGAGQTPCIDTASPYVNVDLIQWAGHPV